MKAVLIVFKSRYIFETKSCHLLGRPEIFRVDIANASRLCSTGIVPESNCQSKLAMHLQYQLEKFLDDPANDMISSQIYSDS